MNFRNIALVLIVLPFLGYWIILPILDGQIRGFSPSDYPALGYILVGLPFLGGLWLTVKNAKAKKDSVGWYILGFAAMLASGVLIYLAIAFSNFGF